MGIKILRLSPDFEQPGGKKSYMFFCPGCECGHGFSTPTWAYNNNPEKPTIRASILTGDGVGNNFSIRRCHSFVTDGMIQFLDDCHHGLKGQTVELPDFD